MNKKISGLCLLLVSGSLQAAAITDLTITGGTFDADGSGGTLTPAAFASLTPGGYDGSAPISAGSSEADYTATSIATYTFGVFGPVAIYTAETDGVDSGFAPVTGDITGSTLTLDLSSWTAYWNGTSFNQGGMITTTIDTNGDFTATWDALILSGPKNSSFATWTITGNASISAVPVPAAIWLMGSGLIGLASIARQRKTI